MTAVSIMEDVFMRIPVLVGVLASLMMGCTTNALKRNTLAQVDTVADLRYAEVLENLAMLDANPEMIPAYSSIYAGTSKIDDSVSVSPGGIFTSPTGNLGLQGVMKTLDIPSTRTVTQTWTLDPVMVPEKIRAIRAACLWALRGPESAGPDSVLLSKYEKPNDGSLEIYGGFYFDVEKDLWAIPHGWLKHSCQAFCAPKSAAFSANYCGNHVWVDHEDLDKLSAFCVVIQKIARANLNTVIQPKPGSESLTIDFTKADKKPQVGKVTINLFGQNGYPTAANNVVLPLKSRLDNLGDNSDIKAVISANAVKSP